ncbi:hypothetical protein LTS18_007636 [Coniosporium uncinatum]|uniref:Uncharacterized protein n=1 Tax=Coniosporium uncinatum TaxID=93489 RepID=A0ACC3D2M7_9PEZI|nr:hypothetical protein LTS18_007636 [Coniosporium uncinatum]
MTILVPPMNESTGFLMSQSHEENLRRGGVYLKSFEQFIKNSSPYVNEVQTAEAAHAHALQMVKASEDSSLGVYDKLTAVQQAAKNNKHQVTLQDEHSLPNIERRARASSLITPPGSPAQVKDSSPEPFEARPVLTAVANITGLSRQKLPKIGERFFVIHLKDLNGRRRHRPLSVSAGELAVPERCPHLIAHGVCNQGTCYVLDCAAYLYGPNNIFDSTPATADNITWDQEDLVHFERGYICDNEHCKGHRYPAGPRCWTRFGLYLTDDIMACLRMLVTNPKHHFTPLDMRDAERLSEMAKTHFYKTTRYNRIWKPAIYYYQPFEYALYGLSVTTWKRKGEFWDEEHECWEGGLQEIVDWKKERISMAKPEMKRYLCYLARKEVEWKESGYNPEILCDYEAWFRDEYES